MNNKALIKKLRRHSNYGDHLRCRYWITCSAKTCFHHEPHFPSAKQCLYDSPVKYCQRVRGFVHDMVYTHGSYNEDECDPNLAFKAKRDAENRSAGYPTLHKEID